MKVPVYLSVPANEGFRNKGSEHSFKANLVDAVPKLHHCISHLCQEQLFFRIKSYNNEWQYMYYESFLISFR